MKTSVTLTIFFFFLVLAPRFTFSQCATTGSIDKGSSTVLDANSDGYFTVYSGSGFTISSNEYTEFEDLAGSGGANVDWTRLTGSEPAQDISGAGCSNTDIVTDADGGADYAYYSIVDPNGTADDGDEYLVFALRIANRVNGAFGYIFLIDADNNCATGDADIVCGNPCFEYEIELQTGNSGGTVDIHNVDGCYGTADCDTRNGGGGSATLCSGCNTDGLQVCAGSSPAACANTPVFWVFYVNFSDLPLLSSTSTFSIVPGSNTSGNPIIYKSANVSDFGGLDDINDVNGDCDCATQCSGSPCSECQQDCLLECASAKNTIGSSGTFPVDFLDFRAETWGNRIRLAWDVIQSGQPDHFDIQILEENKFKTISEVKMRATEGMQRYEFFPQLDGNMEEKIYRIAAIDLDGGITFSDQVAISQPSGLDLIAPEGQSYFLLSRGYPEELELNISDLNGKQILSQTIPPNTTEVPHPPLIRGVYLLSLHDSRHDLFIQKRILK